MKSPFKIERVIVDPVDRNDPARQALSATIAEANDAETAAKSAKEALERAETARRFARDAHDEAAERLGRAKHEQAEKLASAFAAESSPSDTSLVRTARERLTSAEDNLAGMDDAIAQLRSAATDAEDDLARARRRVAESLQPIVTQVAPALLAEAERSQHQYLEKVAVLHAAMSSLHVQSAEYRECASFVGRTGSAVANHLGSGNSVAADRWRSAIEALSRDAYARLPVSEV